MELSPLHRFLNDLLYDLSTSITHYIRVIGLTATLIAFVSWILATVYAHIILTSHLRSTTTRHSTKNNGTGNTTNLENNDSNLRLQELAKNHAASVFGFENSNSSSGGNGGGSGSGGKSVSISVASPATTNTFSSVASSGVNITPTRLPLSPHHHNLSYNPYSSSSGGGGSKYNNLDISPLSHASGIASPVPSISGSSGTGGGSSGIDIGGSGSSGIDIGGSGNLINLRQKVAQESVTNPDILIGWQVSVDIV